MLTAEETTAQAALPDHVRLAALDAAGHALGVVACNGRVDRLTLEVSPAGAEGDCSWDDLATADELFCLAAGPAVVERHYPDVDPWGDDTDQEDFDRLAATAGEDVAEHALRTATAFAAGDKEAAALERIVSALAERGELNHEQLLDVIEGRPLSPDDDPPE